MILGEALCDEGSKLEMRAEIVSESHFLSGRYEEPLAPPKARHQLTELGRFERAYVMRRIIIGYD